MSNEKNKFRILEFPMHWKHTMVCLLLIQKLCTRISNMFDIRTDLVRESRSTTKKKRIFKMLEFRVSKSE